MKALEILNAIKEQETNMLYLEDGSFFNKDFIVEAIIELEEFYLKQKEQLVEHSKIASRALSIGEEEGWFEWKNVNEGAYISLHKDLEKIRDLKEVQDYVRCQNSYIDSLKLKISEMNKSKGK